MILLLLACPSPDDSDSEPVDSDTGETGDSDTADTGDTDTGDTDTGEDVCGGLPECELPTSDETVDCGGTPYEDPPSMTATQSGPGEVQLLMVNVADGCCPDGVDVTATLAVADATVSLAWVLGQDDCDCVCKLDIGATLGEVPVGTWEIVGGGASAVVVVAD